MSHHRIAARFGGHATLRALVAGLAVWSWAVPAIPAAGQESATTATLAGTVRDQAGAAVVGASVEVLDALTGQTRAATSASDGAYRVAGLPAGTYEIRADAEGYAPSLTSDVHVALGRVSTLDLVLEAAGVHEVTTVTDRPQALDRTSPAVTTSIDPERIEELPINSRNSLEFTLLAPGVAPSSASASGGSVTRAGGSSGAPLADSGFTFGGLRPRSNLISIDGVDNTDETTGAARLALSPEIVREFQIVSGGMSAAFGGAGGGAINVVTRTGSNEVHGDAFLFAQNAVFNARDAFAAEDARRPSFDRFRVGAALGGPVVKDRFFSYAALEQEHLSAEEDSGIDDGVRSAIDAGLRSGVAPGLSRSSLASSRFHVDDEETEGAVKLTYLAGTRHTLNGRFAFTTSQESGDAFGTDALTDSSARGSSYTKDFDLTGSVVSVLSGVSINEARFQTSRRQVVTRAGDTVGPGVEIVGLARFARPYEAQGDRHETREQVVDTISLARGSTEWKAGADVNDVRLADDAEEGFGGAFVFATLDDFLAGRPALWRQAFGDARTKLGATRVGAFVENAWAAAPSLTVRLGARYDLERLPAPFRSDANDVAPRLGVAWSPTPSWVVRGGVGLFYDRIPLAFVNRAVQKNGTRAFEQVATDEDAARIFAATGGGIAPRPVAGIAPSVFVADPSFATPYSLQANVGVERLLTPDLTVRADYLFTRGVHLTRTRNVNLAPPVVLTAANAAELGFRSPSPQQLGREVFSTARLDPRFDGVDELETSARSTYRGVTVALERRLSDEWELLGSYTLSSADDDASDFDEHPENPYDLRAERAQSRHHVGQRFTLNALFELGEEESTATGAQVEHEGLLGAIFLPVEVAPILTISSGRPLDPLTGVDDNHSHPYPLSSRPLSFRRDELRTPRFVNLDMRVVRYVPFGGKRRLDFVVEAFNLFNHPNVIVRSPFHGTGATPLATFGEPIAFAAPRQLRFSIDFEF